MTLDEVRIKTRHLWAKSPPEPGKLGLSLLEHTEEVIRQMGEYIKLYRNELQRWPGLDVPRILLYAVLLHDLGKIHPWFQRQLRDGTHFGLRHEILSLAFVKFLDIPDEENAYLVAAIALHHKDWRILTEGTSKSPAYYSTHLPLKAITPLFELVTDIGEETLELVISLLENSVELIFQATEYKIKPYPLKLNNISLVEAMYQGLQQVYELIKGFETRGGRGRSKVINQHNIYKGVLIRGLMLSADHLASAMPSQLESGLGTVGGVLKAIGREATELRYHQQKITESGGNRILIAPTGFGKTEAAILWAVKQKEETGSYGRVFFLLPYRASMNAMAQRFIMYFGESSTTLIHAKSLAKTYEKLIEEGYDTREAVNIAKLKESVARLNKAPYRICSPYQLIRSFFGISGSEALICSAIGSQLIFDEIHAYDPKVTAMALASCRYLCEMYNTRVLFMSATLPKHLLGLIQRLFPGIPEPITIPEDMLASINRHRLELVEENIFSEKSIGMIQEAAQGNSVLVVVNQVKRAVKLFEVLKGAGFKEVVLLHGRFNVRDRIEKEKLLDPHPGKILIATQVVEVSVDIDYDFGFFELAPLEALLQRFGRVNRKGKNCWATVKVFTEFDDTSSRGTLPYDHDHLSGVKSLLKQYIRDYPQGFLRENLIQDLLDASYPQSLKNQLEKDLEEKLNDFQRYFIEEYRPFGIRDNLTIREIREKWDELFDGFEVLPEKFIEEGRKANNTLEVAKLMVPIHGSQFRRLFGSGMIYRDEQIAEYIVKSDYDEEKGLLF